MTLLNKVWWVVIDASAAALPWSCDHNSGARQPDCNYDVATLCGHIITICDLHWLASNKQLMGKLAGGHRWQPCHYGVLQPCGFTNNGNWDFSNCHRKLALSLDIVPYNCIALVTEFPVPIAIGKWGLLGNLFSCILQCLFSNYQFSLVGDPWQHLPKSYYFQNAQFRDFAIILSL